MSNFIDIALSPAESYDEEKRNLLLANSVKEKYPQKHWRISRRSIDARQKKIKVIYRIALSDESFLEEPSFKSSYQDVAKSNEVHIVGAGPAGYFAALEMLELGLRPIVFDRGKDVRSRRRDLKAIQQEGIVHPDSNYCFGEGGAGTYSDGKLYTRSHKRGSIEKILKVLVEHGASSDIMIDAHPHIGSNKLPVIIAEMRNSIESKGGEVHFDSKLNDLIIADGKLQAIQINDSIVEVDQLVLATGHSARDIYYLLESKKVHLDRKDFALGVRIEHPQALIDELRYRQRPRVTELPAASYALNCQVGAEGIFSFCMCPGGLVVPAATNPGEIVLNGMSLSRRDSAYANSGVVMTIGEKMLQEFLPQGVFASLAFQKSIEQALFNIGDGTQKAPAQRLDDFVNGKLSNDLPKSSYIPGLHSQRLDQLLPQQLSDYLREGVKLFDKKMKGYITREAVVLGPESRTSAPIRIPRDEITLMSPDVQGLFPCGEGAGYAGGIVSAAMDGIRISKATNEYINR